MKAKSVITKLSLSIIFFAFIALPDSDHESNRLRSRFFEGKLSALTVPLVDQQVTISLELTAIAGDCKKATIKFRAPKGVLIIGPDVFESQSFTRGSTRRYLTNIEFTQQNCYILQATVYFQLPNGQSEAEHFYMIVGKPGPRIDNKSLFHVTWNFGKVPSNLGEAKIPSAAPSNANQNTGGTLSVRGYITYYNDNLSHELPIRGISVELWKSQAFPKLEELLDGDKKAGQLMDSTLTDDSGFYSFDNISSVGTGWYIQLRVSFENDALSITDANDLIYRFESPVIYNVSDGQLDINYCLNERDQRRGLGHIFNCIMDAYSFLQDTVSWHRNKITVKWPYGEYPMYKYFHYLLAGTIYQEYIQVPAGWEWERAVMLHEYGHAVMTGMYKYNNNILPRSSFQGDHSIFTVTDAKFAMKEGWAEFFEAIVDNNAYNVRVYANADTPNIESNRWWTGDPEGQGRNTRGEIVEGSVASILWDIADTEYSLDASPATDDDDMDGMFKELWDIMLKYTPFSILTLWEQWARYGYSQTHSLYSIYINNGIKVDIPLDLDTGASSPVITKSSTEKLAEPAGIRGDVNNDGKISSNDAFLVLRVASGLMEPTDYQRWAADINNDHKVGADDAMLILNRAIGLNEASASISMSYKPLPEQSASLQNYPNPFNTGTWIPYQLKDGGQVSIQIHDMKGKLVSEIHLGYKSAGMYLTKDKAIYWDGMDGYGTPVASGIYFYIIHVIHAGSSFSAAGKMIILR